MPVSRIVDQFMREFDRPLADVTGLQGIYDIDLRWRQKDPALQPDPPAGEASEPTRPPRVFVSLGADAVASLSAALKSQVGLALEPRRTPMDIVVVEQANRTPTEN